MACVGEDEEDDVTIEGHHLKLKEAYSVQSRQKDQWISLLPGTPKKLAGITQIKQTIMVSRLKKKARGDFIKYVARWFYEAGFPFKGT